MSAEAEQVAVARARRDPATRWFMEMRDATESGDPGALLTEFQRAAADPVRPLVDAWGRRRRDGAQAATSATAAHLAALRDKDERHLTEAQVAATGPTARGRFGMCGRLDVHPGSDVPPTALRSTPLHILSSPGRSPCPSLRTARSHARAAGPSWPLPPSASAPL
ncbi:hypothetical protein [Streptomyces acidicola]|uniref:hypothetical protein n=1 Tax=Streptomyces acidicola TaxID=2596892 RepID=UPI001883AE85|nr:hypothetical protein [Streptomyces acidicola]